MPNNETNRDRQERRVDTDLDDQYRPIGIGAVAAALTAGRKTAEQSRTAEQPAPGAANTNDRQHDRESLAA